MKIFFLALFVSTFVPFWQLQAAPAGLTLQGRLMKSSQPVSGAVSLVVQVTSPNSDGCLLYEETHSLNLSPADGGTFSVKIGGGTRTSQDQGLSLVNVFSNRPTTLTGCNQFLTRWKLKDWPGKFLRSSCKPRQTPLKISSTP